VQPGGRAEDPEAERLWRGLASSSAVEARQIVRSLVARPKDAVAWIRGRLRAVPRAAPRRIARWITDLDSDSYRVRRRAARELKRLAEQAEPALRRAAVGGPSPEVRHMARVLLDELRNDRFRPPPDRRQACRAIEVLEEIGDGAARKSLEVLAAGAPEAFLTIEAQGALERLGQGREAGP
jgi:hypothetical protein